MEPGHTFGLHDILWLWVSLSAHALGVFALNLALNHVVSPIFTLWEMYFYHIPYSTHLSHLLSQWSLLQLSSVSPYDASLFWRLSIALIIPVDLLWTFLALLCFSWAQRAALPAGVHTINVHSNTEMRTGVFFFFSVSFLIDSDAQLCFLSPARPWIMYLQTLSTLIAVSFLRGSN